MIKKSKKINKPLIVLFIICAIIFAFILLAKFEKPRFNKGALDDPSIIKANEEIQPRVLQGSSDIEVLLVHGLGATAWETSKLADFLNSRNITTRQVLLAGHGTNIYDLEKTNSEEWYQSVEKAYNEMQKPKKFVIGESLGGLLAIELSAKKELKGAIIFSPPIFFKNPLVRYSPLLMYFKRFSYRDIEPQDTKFYYENFPTRSLAEMIGYFKTVKPLMNQVNLPFLVIESRDDPRVAVESVQYVYDHIGSEKKELLLLNSSMHVLITEQPDEDIKSIKEREAIFDKVYNFIMDNSK